MKCWEANPIKIVGSEPRLHVVFEVVGQVAKEPVLLLIHKRFQGIESTMLGSEADLRSSAHRQQAVVLTADDALVAVAVKVAGHLETGRPIESPLLEIMTRWKLKLF